MCAAHSGGINEAITHPADMAYDNMMMQTNVIKNCYDYSVKKLLFLGSSCVYPVNGKQPYTEDQIGDGKTDENWAYASVKIAGIELCKAFHRQYGSNFITAIPCNIYGPHDNFNIEYSHVIPALLKKMYDAYDNIEMWGDGTPEREFMYSDDFADAAVFLMENVDYDDIDGVVNAGTGENVSIKTLLSLICNITDKNHVYPYWNSSRPNGVKSKLMDSSKIHKLGWKHKIGIREGLERTYRWYIENRTSNQPG
jgi:GDP-L-fucose synthase